MSNLSIQKKSTAIFAFNIVAGGGSCTTNQDQDYILQYQASGTSSILECFTPGRYQSITSGASVTQNTNWGGYANAFWQQHRWATDVNTPYGSYGTPKVYVDGCVLNASCSGGVSTRYNWAMPQIDMTWVSATPTSLDVILNCGFGSLKLPYDADMALWEEVNGVWVQLTSTTCPNGTNSLSGGYNPTINITYGTGDVGVHHYKMTYETNDPNPLVTNYKGFADMYVMIGASSFDLPTPETPEHSFVTFNGEINPTCAYDRTVCYPVVSMNDIQFQMTIDVAQTGCYGNFPTPILGDGTNSGTQIYLCVSEDCNIPTEIATAGDYANYVAKLDTWYNVPFTDIWTNNQIYWGDVMTYITSHFSPGQCYKLLLCKREPDTTPGEWIDTVIGCSDDCFAWVQDDCYTSVIQYRSNNDELCFYYSQDVNWYNSIRLPMFLRNPQYPSTQQGYQLSDGTFKKLSERIQEEWELEVGWMNAKKHKALKFALAHDTVLLNDVTSWFGGQIYANGNYDIKWDTKPRPYPLAKATTKVNRTINNCSVNSNC